MTEIQEELQEWKRKYAELEIAFQHEVGRADLAQSQLVDTWEKLKDFEIAHKTMVEYLWFPRFIGTRDGKQRWVAFSWMSLCELRNSLMALQVVSSGSGTSENWVYDDPITCLVKAYEWWQTATAKEQEQKVYLDPKVVADTKERLRTAEPINLSNARGLIGETEPCCECGEPYPRADLILRDEIYCPRCRAAKVITEGASSLMEKAAQLKQGN